MRVNVCVCLYVYVVCVASLPFLSFAAFLDVFRSTTSLTEDGHHYRRTHTPHTHTPATWRELGSIGSENPRRCSRRW